MEPRRRLRSFVLSLAAVLLLPGAASAQLEPRLGTQLVVSGLSEPLGFVQDPSNAAVQYIVQKGGRIRVLSGGVLQAADFLNLSTVISTSGERGLLGLAFPADYATSGRFYVDCTDTSGNIVVARFTRSSGNPLVANAASRFDLVWSTGLAYIAHPGASNHNGGHLAFGTDGYLYISTGDGGGSTDPATTSQDLTSLLGKLLRIDVSVDDADAEGFDIPATNPFLTAPARPEVWALGLRNPWQFSIDPQSGALIIGDVGQGAREEIDVQPAGVGGLNYGWHRYEGTLDYNRSVTLSSGTYKAPRFEYDRTAGASIIGGFVYRGTMLRPDFTERYLFADFVTGRVWSIALGLQPGDSWWGSVRDLTPELTRGGPLGNISAFGQDASGEPYLVDYSGGRILRITFTPLLRGGLHAQPGFAPVAGSTNGWFNGIQLSGWAVDLGDPTGPGIDDVHVYAFPSPGSGTPPIFLGSAKSSGFVRRPDVGALFGARYEQSGFNIHSMVWLPPEPSLIVLYAHQVSTGRFEAVATFTVSYLGGLRTSGFVHSRDQIPAGPLMQPITISGWALDPVAATAPPAYGTGIARVNVNIFHPDGRFEPVRASTVARPDVAAIFGSRFLNSGYSLTLYDLPPGHYRYSLTFYLGPSADVLGLSGGEFDVLPGPMMAIGTPAEGVAVSGQFLVSGWAVDLRAASGTGIDAVHAWAYRDGNPTPTFLGAATYGSPRSDIASRFGAQFANSGFNLIAGPLASGSYQVVVFARVASTMQFEINRIVRIVVP